MSCVLFHGPGAYQAALDRAARMGRLVAPPYGQDGLKTDTAREIVTSLLSSPVGQETGVVIVGPMDQAQPRASDVLLKCIEDLSDGVVRPVLWADDLGDVSPTIRSRCLTQWSPGIDEQQDDAIIGLAWKLVDASVSGEWEHLPAIYQAQGKERELVAAIAGALSTDIQDTRKQQLWARLRQVARWRNPQLIEILSALVGEDG